MIKYRRLTDAELKELEPEFKQFLISNGIYDAEWKEINETNADKALDLVDLFSDLVLEKSLEEVKYLIHTTSSELKVFWYRQEEAYLIALNSKTEGVDFNQENWMVDFPEHANEVEFFKQEKKVTKGDRSKEIFTLLKAGAKVSSEEFYKMIHDLVSSEK